MLKSDLGSAGAPVGFDLKPRFFAADPVDDFQKLHPINRVQMRLQSTGNRVEEADLVYLNIASVRDAALAGGAALPLGSNTNARASLLLHATCPTAEAQIGLDGTVTFSAFGSAGAGAVPDDFRLQFGDHLAGTIAVDVIDRRTQMLEGLQALAGQGSVPTTPSVLGHFDGQFDFVIRQGQAAQAYP
jgi:hypothetical protein